MYKKALNSFFLKVHPDFFFESQEKQKINENSVAQLNELLGWAKEMKAGNIRPPPAKQITFTFYPRATEDSSGSNTSTVGAAADKMIQSTFELPSNFVASSEAAHNSKGTAERAVNKFLRDLLRRADCLDSVASEMSAAEDAAAARLEAKPLRKRPRVKGKPASNKGTKGEGQEGEGETASESKSLLDEALETMRDRWSLTPAPSLEELIDSDLVIFDKDRVSPAETSVALQTLKANLGELAYEKWESMPLVISDHFAVDEHLSGSLTVPWDFLPLQFVSFLQLNEARIMQSKAAVQHFASEVEVLIAEICNALELDDILISCPHRQAVPLLKLLHQNKEILNGYGLTQLTLEVGTRHATRANGVIIIDYKMRSTGELEEWLRAIQPKIELQKKLYAVSKQLLEATLWHLREFRAVVEPAGVEAFFSGEGEYTYAQRLTWAKELFRIAPSLAKWDWSEFAFVLSPALEINWETRQMALPYNFDGDALVRYVEEVQKETKSHQREELLQQSAMRELEAEEARAREHAKQLQLEEDGGEMREEGVLDAEAERQRLEKLQRTFRRTNPELEEYLSSSYMSDSSKAAEPLSVERPLSHSLTFNSDEEADQQLRWEGFYQSPYVDQTPTQDLDDMDHTFRLTNRWHREAAAKKLLEELQSTYGKKSRKFDYQKMGDVLEINNVKVQPKGFPVLHRGLRPGS